MPVPGSLLSLAGAAESIIFVATRVCRDKHVFCRDKIMQVSFWSLQKFFSRQTYFCHDKRCVGPIMRCDLSRLVARKITKGIHSCKPAALNRQIAEGGRAGRWGRGGVKKNVKGMGWGVGGVGKRRGRGETGEGRFWKLE